MPDRVTIRVIQGDALHHPATVLVLKHAQALYGVDKIVVSLLRQRGVEIDGRLPRAGATLLVESNGAVAARYVLFVGVPPLGRFDYAEIRGFSTLAFEALKEHGDAHQIVMTLHGRGFGLDETEAFKAEVAGIVDALRNRTAPVQFQEISILELDEQTADRLRTVLADLLPSSGGSTGIDIWRYRSGVVPTALRDVGARSREKPHIFVAMPFAAEFDDRFHYGIRNAANAAGYLCERADLASFTGDVIAWVRDRIDKASLVVADLSSANPNVYLEVGYAWGRGVRTVLVVSSASELRFNVRGQRCLMFTSIRQLEGLLTQELKNL